MSLQQLQDHYIKQTGGIKKITSLTDVVPFGTTIFYGRSGAGKTYSMIKHLISKNIKPMLLDFDDNPKLDFDYFHINGEWFLNMKKQGEHKRKQPRRDLEKFMLNNKLDARKHLDIDYSDYISIVDYEDRVFPRLTEPSQAEFSRLFDLDMETPPETRTFVDETVIIDTYVKIVELIGLDGLKDLIAYFKRQNCNVIVISHETGERGKDTGVDEVFANHCDGRLRLCRDITKTKQDTYLIVEKMRGYKGDNTLFDWER